MDDLQFIKSKLAAIPISRLPTIAKSMGVPFGTLLKVKYGNTKNPRHNTVQLAADWFRDHGHVA